MISIGSGLWPAAWRTDRLLLADRARWEVAAVGGDDEAVLLATVREELVTLLGRGGAAGVARLLTELVTDPDARPLIEALARMTLPRGTDVCAEMPERLGLAPVSRWDWMVTDTPPRSQAGEERVRRLDPVADAHAIRDCLRAANPGTSADPCSPGEAAWFGAPGGVGLLGVAGAAWRCGRPGGRDASWHLHGLGVQPSARGAGLGAAITAAATRAGFDAGVDWVSLALYADNDRARRLYRRLGFTTEGEFSWFAQPETVRR